MGKYSPSISGPSCKTHRIGYYISITASSCLATSQPPPKRNSAQPCPTITLRSCATGANLTEVTKDISRERHLRGDILFPRGGP